MRYFSVFLAVLALLTGLVHAYVAYWQLWWVSCAVLTRSVVLLEAGLR
jgi:hypothetical protein